MVELIIVIAIMAALVAILAPQYMRYVDKSRKQADANVAEEIFTACKVAATDEDVASDFTATWQGTTITFGGDTDVDQIVADALGLTLSGRTVPLVSKYKGTIDATNDYVVTYTAATATTEATVTQDGGWWN